MKTKPSQKSVPEGWNLVKLGSIADFKKGKGLSKRDLHNDGEHDAIHYGELFTKYSEKITKVLSKTGGVKGAFLSKKNDILMPTSDVTPRGLSTASYLDKDGVILGGDILVIRAKPTQLNGLFLVFLSLLKRRRLLSSCLERLYFIYMALIWLSWFLASHPFLNKTASSPFLKPGIRLLSC
jgi:type I restriction enzyme S subunit